MKYKHISRNQKYKINNFMKWCVGYWEDTEENHEYFEQIEITEPKITYKYISETDKSIKIEINCNCLCGGIYLRIFKIYK